MVDVNGLYRMGTVKYLGTTEFAPGDWVGVAFDRPYGQYTLSTSLSNLLSNLLHTISTLLLMSLFSTLVIYLHSVVIYSVIPCIPQENTMGR